MRKIAAIPTMTHRVSTLRFAVLSLVDQVDCVYVVLNGFSEAQVPRFLKDSPKIEPLIPQKDHGSANRFLVSKFAGNEDFIFYCDDDLQYPSDYVDRAIEGYEKYKCPITFHGRVLFKNKPVQGWRGWSFEKICTCLGKVAEDTYVDIAGTGVLMLCKDDFAPVPEDFKYPNYDDVEFSILARRAGKKIMCLSHKKGWLKYLKPDGETIFDITQKVGHGPLINLVNESKLWKKE